MKDKEIGHALIEIKELADLLTDRISDLHEVKGGMQARHCYIFYRERLYAIRNIIENISSKEEE